MGFTGQVLCHLPGASEGDEGKSGLPVSQDVVLFEKAVRGMEVSL